MHTHTLLGATARINKAERDVHKARAFGNAAELAAAEAEATEASKNYSEACCLVEVRR